MNSSSFFYLQADKNDRNSKFLEKLEQFADENKQQIYVINRPLGEKKYTYACDDGLVILIPKYKILFAHFDSPTASFHEFCDDFIEDLGSISDKYRYKTIIGRPKQWSDKVVSRIDEDADTIQVDRVLNAAKLDDGHDRKVCELLISLLTGSINDIDKVKDNVPDNILDKVKQKILLFDGDQTRFVYQPYAKNKVQIQGLSGTGKTELLLHKLKELYVGNDSSKIMFTCHNRILATNLKKRIPEFFNFMKVEQQIEWEKRLWCVHAWGSRNDPNSGAYRFICSHYGLSFYPWTQAMSFERACEIALKELTDESIAIAGYAFDFMLIDESQDFPPSFIELCSRVTKQTIYVAGDIFQSIFETTIINKIEPDFLLSKCYRTDPRTLMFAHSLGMGLFETPKLRWLEDAEWKACGYIVEKDYTGTNYTLRREPLRRFEDLEAENISSMDLVAINNQQSIELCILDLIADIQNNNPTVLADDIGIMFMGTNNDTFFMADLLEVSVPQRFGWKINKAYESKEKITNTLFVSNKNNVKGLEFPFVICVASKINSDYNYRNALYMMLTRSFIKSYLLLSADKNAGLIPSLEGGLAQINGSSYIKLTAPSAEEQEKIKTTISYSADNRSYYDVVQGIFEELSVLPILRTPLFDAVKALQGDEVFEYEKLKEIIVVNHRIMQRQ